MPPRGASAEQPGVVRAGRPGPPPRGGGGGGAGGGGRGGRGGKFFPPAIKKIFYLFKSVFRVWAQEIEVAGARGARGWFLFCVKKKTADKPEVFMPPAE